MNSRSERPDAPVYVLAVCETCGELFAELQSDFYARKVSNREKPYCISCDPKAEAEVITLTAKGFEEADS